jgi:hypothetical protein
VRITRKKPSLIFRLFLYKLAARYSYKYLSGLIITLVRTKDLIDILIVAGMETSLEEDLGRFEKDA